MYLERLLLRDFRSYHSYSLNLSENTLLVGANGLGKSNLLEAVNLAACGVSERAGKLDEMIRWGSEVGSVEAIVRDNNGEYTELAVVLTRGSVLGKKTPKRRFLVNGVSRTQANFSSFFYVILFVPEDMRLIEGSKERRRRYLDMTLSQVHSDYAAALFTYMASLKRRNHILDNIREGRAKEAELAYWDQSLVKNGNIISDYRRNYLEYLSQSVNTRYGSYNLEYVASQVSPERLAQHHAAEVALGYTLIGPHKDDFLINSVDKGQKIAKNLMVYGSRGEQRLGVLFLKMGAMEYSEAKSGVKPIILLDDIFSELDETNRSEVIKMCAGHQTILTSAELGMGSVLPGYQVVELG